MTCTPTLENSLLIYDDAGKKKLADLYFTFVNVAHSADVPILICAPTWRANQERLLAAHITKDINGDAVQFLRQVSKRWGAWAENIMIGGLIGCKNDCYKPDEGLSEAEAEDFHFWQISGLAKAGVDCILAATLPALPEAIGIARAMAKTTIPYIISFVINRDGRVLDGNSLESSFRTIDSLGIRPPVGYMVNCSYPSFLKGKAQPRSVLSRLIGYQANASSYDHAQLDGAETLQADDISEWGNLMVELNRRYGVKILGGCCGTTHKHLQYIVQNLKKKDRH